MNKNLKFLTSSFIIALTLATPQLVHATEPESFPFDCLPNDLKHMIIKEAAIEHISNPKRPFSLAVVCKSWCSIINHTYKPMHKECVNELYNIRADEEKIFETFYNGVLVYRPTLESDEGMIKFKISDLKNSLDGTFNLSQCGDASKYLSISTGYCKEKEPEKELGRLEIWIAPRFLIAKELDSTASHFNEIMPDWNHETAPMGIFFTWGKRDAAYGYLISKKPEFIYNNDLECILHASSCTKPRAWWSARHEMIARHHARKFHVHF